MCALVASNFSLERFTFIGFLDSKSSGRRKQLEEIKKYKETLIFYESPHRLKEMLADLLKTFGNRRVVVARELTKKFEEYIRGTISEVIEEMDGIKGEIVVIVEGNKSEKISIGEDELIQEISIMIERGISKKEVVSIIVDKYDLKKNYVYNLVCKM